MNVISEKRIISSYRFRKKSNHNNTFDVTFHARETDPGSSTIQKIPMSYHF